jgi:chromosome segregation ATPase
LQETREHLKNSIEVQIEHQGKDLQNLDNAHHATVQVLAATKRFTDDFHEEFKMTKQHQDDLNTSNTNQFVRVQERLAHLSTMLTETINRLNTHANHLRSTNGVVRTMGEKVDTLADNHHKLRLQTTEISEDQINLQHLSTVSEERLRQLNGQLGEAEKAKKAMGAGLDCSLGKLSAGLTSAQETLKYHTNELLPTQNKRMLRLEMYNARLLSEIKELHNQLGSQLSPTTVEIIQVSPPAAEIIAETSSSEMPDTTALPQMPQVTQTVTRGPALAGAAGALMGVGMRARLDKCNRKLEDHDQELAMANQKLQEAQDDLKVKTKRMEKMEKALEALGKCVSETRDGLELTEEWWKGLSHGFRETHRQFNVDSDFLKTTRPNTALSMATTQSGATSRTHSRPQSRPQSARGRPEGLMPLGSLHSPMR